MSITLFYQRPIHSTLYLLLSILFTDKLVRYILFKFHSYFNQHKVNVIEAFLMPFITLLSSLFINIKQHKISFEFTLYDYYPHLRLPYRTYIYSNILRFVIQSIFLVFFKNQLKSSSVKEDAVNYFCTFDNDGLEEFLAENEDRGASLGSYDGEEFEEEYDGEWYYIYRID